LLLAAACRLPAADHERLGDEAYRESRHDDALAEYQAAQRAGARSRVWAKAGAAALHARDFGAAVDAFRSLAESDPTRSTEAAVGLSRVIEAALRDERGDPGIASKAVLALRAVAPTRPLGRLAEFPLAAAELEPRELLGMLPTAIATAATPSTVDSLLVRYAEALRTTTACEGAVRAYQAVLRRADRGPLRASARQGLAGCGLLLGLDALASQRGDAAERWFNAVLAVETSSERAWRAQIGRGDARLLLGDALGASVAYQAVLGAAGVPDSVRALAASRLNSLGQASAEPPGVS
jgi:hypothetical protein